MIDVPKSTKADSGFRGTGGMMLNFLQSVKVVKKLMEEVDK